MLTSSSGSRRSRSVPLLLRGMVNRSATFIRRARPPGWMAWLSTNVMGDDLFGREVSVGVPFLRRRVPVADEIDVQPAAHRRANGGVDTNVGRRSDNDNRCNAAL
jgi:hypothetical protein